MVDFNQISEELLAAFLEGKTDSAETMQVLNAIANNNDLAELVSDVSIMDEIDNIAQDVDNGYLEFGIDLVDLEEDIFQLQPDLVGDLHEVIEIGYPEILSEELEVACYDSMDSSDESTSDFDENIFDSDEGFSEPGDSLLSDDDFFNPNDDNI